jgi:hypothetical protein
MSLLDKASLVMTPNAVKESKVYSIIPSNGNGDFTFTRGTLASSTLTNDAGLIEIVPYNLLQYSEQFDNASFWNKQQITVSNNASNSPNGTSTADKLIPDTSLNQHRIFQLANFTGQGVLSVYAKADGYNFLSLGFSGGVTGASIIFDLSTGTFSGTSGGVTPTIESVGNNWYRCSISSAVLGVGASLSYWIVVRNANNVSNYNGDGVSGVLTWGAQLVQGSIPKDYFFTTDRLNVPRLNYDSAGGCPSLLLEPQRTNRLLNSVWAGGAIPTSWSQFTTGGTLTPTTSIKNPNVTAFNFAGTASRNFISQTQAFTNGYIYAISFYVESVTTTAFLDTIIGTSVVTGNSTYLKNNVAVNGSTEAIVAGNTYTLVYAATLTSAIATFRIGLGTSGNSTANFTISMPQMEIGVSNTASYSTSFIPTTTTGIVTRNADSFTRNSIFTNGLITSAGGTWFLEVINNLVYIRDSASSGIYLDTNNASFTSGFNIRTEPTNRRLSISKWSPGSVLYTTLVDIVKIAIKWNGVTADVFVNGTKVVSATAFTTTEMQFLGGRAEDCPKNIKQIALFPTPLTDAECIAITQ